LSEQGKPAEAEAAYRKAIAVRPDYAMAHTNLGYALHRRGQHVEAVAAFRQAIAVQPDLAEAYEGLGLALQALGQRGEAEAAYRKSIALLPDRAETHHHLAGLLQVKGQVEEAEATYHKAIALQDDLAEAHCDLGALLKYRGQFSAALAELRRGHDLGSRRRGWTYPSAQWVQEAERLLAQDERLGAVLRGEAKPADAAEQLRLAQQCQQWHKRFHAAAARLYAAAFTAQPRLADDVSAGHRYNAACSAALAGCGQCDDQPVPDEAERRRWRQQALDWLRADLAWWHKQAESDKPADRVALRQTLARWQDDADLAGVRGEPALARLPAAEREGWRRLWADVTDLLAALPTPSAATDAKKKVP
jgi:serine/threonine-protein kinase